MILSNVKVYAETTVIRHADIEIRDEKIHSITPHQHTSPEQYSLVPGFIDIHIHGANGSDVMDATPAALEVISQALLAEGTTAFLATTMTVSTAHLEKVLQTVRETHATGAEILGVHLEGPFLSPQKIGAQAAEHLLIPNVQLLKHWQKISNNAIKLVTLAPELPQSLEMIRYLQQNNIVASIGHTDATYAQTQAAIAAGCSHVTHLFNAMRGIHQREPGVVTAALLSDAVTAELILDGVHLHPAIAELSWKLKGAERMILVTDAMRAKCLQDGTYDLGGQQVIVKNAVAQLENGTLAGSVLKMSNAVQNAMKFTGCDLHAAVKMASENPAKRLGIFDRKGSVAVGKDADLVLLDEQCNIAKVICRGSVLSFSV